MKKYIILLGLFLLQQDVFAQSWTKISSNFDSLWTSSVHYFNKGDTIIHYGSVDGTGFSNAKRFYVSLDGGNTYTRDFTPLDAIAYTPVIGLPLNNMIIGFENVPNSGSYSFQSIGNWSSLLPTGLGTYGDFNLGTLLFSLTGSTTLRTLKISDGSITTVASGAAGLELLCTRVLGSRVLIGGKNSKIKYLDNEDFTSMQNSTFGAGSANGDVVRFFESSGVLYAVINGGFDYLHKSTDNGANWEIVETTYTDGLNTFTLNSNFIIGTPNGNIFFLKNGNSDDVYLSTDGGLTATKISTGLPVDALQINPTSKLLVNGNKVWYQVRAANTVDFVRTDTDKAGLYLFDAGTSSLDEQSNEAALLKTMPNPCQDYLMLQKESGLYNVKLYNSMGELLLETELTGTLSYQFETANYPAGVYQLVHENQRGQREISRIVKLD